MAKANTKRSSANSALAVESFTSEQIVEALRAWKEESESVNAKEILKALRLYRSGNFTVRLPENKTGIAGEIARAFNESVELNQLLTKEFERVGKAVGKEGNLNQRITVAAATGSWANEINSFNSTLDYMVEPVREFSRVVTAVAKGDLSEPMALDIGGRAVKGEFLRVAKVTNKMIDLLNIFSSEVTRVAQEVGTDGKLGGQAKVKGVTGVWKDLTDNVNAMADNLTSQVRNIADVATAVAKGDLDRKVTVEVKGEVLQLKNTINSMVDQLAQFSSEVTRVAQEVGTDGKLGGQAEVVGVSGVWNDLTNNVNAMADNLTSQVRDIAKVATAVAEGDLDKKVTVEAKGEIADLKNTINSMVEQLSQFSSEVTRVAQEVGTDGKLGGQAEVKGVAGVWNDLTNNVNAMADNLTSQVRNIADVTTAVAKGNLNQRITVEVKGEIADLKNTINSMVDQLSQFSSEVTRVAQEVGTDGKLGGQAEVTGVSGVWKELTENVNIMADNLTSQVRDIAKVATAVAEGDLEQKITVEARGETADLKSTINEMIDQLARFSSEVTRVAQEVGTEGKLGGQADVKSATGVWKDLTDNVNAMADNLTSQVRNIADVTTAVAKGDLNQRITVEVKGEIADLKNTINSMVDQLSQFSSEVTRVAQEVGTDGKLGGQAEVKGVGGVWQDLTNNVNAMADNLTAQVRDIAKVATAVAEGDLKQRINVEVKGEVLQLKNTINSMVDQLSEFSSEVTRVAQEVGTDGKLGGQAEVKGVTGVWSDLTSNVNAMADNLTSQVRDIATVATAVAEGDLDKKITVEAKGEIADLKTTINAMIDRLSQFSSEVTRVAQEVGTEGNLGGQAEVKGVAGVWKDLTDNVNAMADNLTSQVRDIAQVTTAVANGDLNQRITVEVKGEILQLKNTINSMVDQLSQFSSEVTRVAQEVGTDGELGGQADVPEASGTWRDLTDNVNELADNLTRQVRAIFEVVTTITRGDLSAVIEVDAKGEVEDLKNGLNTMIKTLKSTSELNEEQDWLKTNLSKFGDLLQGKKDVRELTEDLIKELCQTIVAQHGVFYYLDKGTEDKPKDPQLQLLSSYAYKERKHISNTFDLGDGLVGQCGLEQKTILIKDVPNDYIKINSGLGEATPLNLVVLPVLFEDDLVGVIELASFEAFSENTLNFLEQLMVSVGLVTNTVRANMRTENLLKESQSLSEELQTQQDELQISNKKLEEQAKNLQESEVRLKSQQEELQQTNEELEEKSKVLGDQKIEVEQKNTEVTKAKEELQEKADQLALTSKYKSEFLANMSHELRTPLNSLLVLSENLSKNVDKNLSDKQLKHAFTIHDSGVELLDLINEILDMAKIESGTMSIDISDVFFKRLEDWSKRGFQQVAEKKNITFDVELAKALPKSIRTDEKRLQQIIKNLLSNAIKFTENGGVIFDISIAKDGWDKDHAILNQAGAVIAFSVTDTGIGIAEDKQHVIFEAFQQGDGTTSRKYGGTGLGLSISREIAVMLGGEITLTSEEGKGSTFTFYVPQDYIAPKPIDITSSGDGSSLMKTLPSMSTSALVETHGPSKLLMPSEVPDDRADITDTDKVVLIIEDDTKFANILLDMSREQGFKSIVALTGEAGLACAQEYQPDAIILDIRLPEMSGWTVLDRIKHDPKIRHIPVHIASIDDVRQRSLKSGALSFMQKPADQKKLSSVFNNIKQFGEKKQRQLLLIEDNETQRNSIIELIGNGDVIVTAVASAEEALKKLKANEFDCMVLDLMLPDMNGFELIEKIKKNNNLINLPIIIYTGKELSKKEENKLKEVAETVIIKDVMSPERLLDETALFLHRIESKLPESKRQMLQQVHESDPTFAGRKILIVDDDMRNIYALSAIFEGHEASILYAESGVQALDSLKKNPDVELILMDIMMPEMDGYETMQAIRKMAKFKNLPIIAVTAKAMKEDREKCIAAGASDYIVKPIDTEQLLSLSRVWLYK